MDISNKKEKKIFTIKSQFTSTSNMSHRFLKIYMMEQTHYIVILGLGNDVLELCINTKHMQA